MYMETIINRKKLSASCVKRESEKEQIKWK
jgi:hypothetical protein